jgi:ribonuclease HI
LALTRSPTPPLRRARCKRKCTAYFGFGDASGAGFGGTLQIGDKIYYEYGQWISEVTEQASSNWRELNNLVEALERACKVHELRGCEILLFTDNMTAEAAFWKGTSQSPKLFELVLRLRKLEMARDLMLHVIHVCGRRMIEKGHMVCRVPTIWRV